MCSSTQFYQKYFPTRAQIEWFRVQTTIHYDSVVVIHFLTIDRSIQPRQYA